MFTEMSKTQSCVIAALVAISLSSSVNAQSLIQNSFFDSDIDGWTLAGGPESAISWDGTEGSPVPGSLRLSTTLVPLQPTTVEVLSDCVNDIPSGILSVTGMVLQPTQQPGVNCYVTFALYQGSDCMGNAIDTSGFPPNTAGVWEESGISGDFSSGGVPSAQASLTMALNGPDVGEKVCLFDTVLMSNFQGTTVTDVPTLSWPGLMVFALLVAAIAVSLARRRSRARRDS